MFRQKKLQPEQQLLQKETKNKNKKVFKYNTPNYRKVIRGACYMEKIIIYGELPVKHEGKKMEIALVKNNDMGQEDKLYINESQKQTLMQVLQENNIFVPHVCNGNGTCGKCRIKVISGRLPVTEADRRCLLKEELEKGIRLSCKVRVEDIMKNNSEGKLVLKFIRGMEEDIVVESVTKNVNKYNEKVDRITVGDENITDRDIKKDITNQEYFIAIDIGTTTIAMALIDIQKGEICDTYTSLNHQRQYGADVLSRITAANHGKADELRRLIEEDLKKGICALMQTANQSLKTKREAEKNKQKEDVISYMIISGNTTMIHLFMGYSCETLGKYPFVSEHLGKIECMFQGISTIILPGISAFVGGDLMAGILVCPGFQTEELSLLIDFGTNGEMVLGNKHKLLTASTAVGPAFEGGGITCGMAGIPGSICRVKIEKQRAVVKTIQNKLPPLGICGTGLVSAVTELLENCLIDEQGVFRYPYQKTGYPLWTFENGEKIAVYQRDIREFQMAKSAIRTGIDILMEEYGCKVDEIKHVYLAGGFGVHLSERDAVTTGMLPGEFTGKIEFIGNGALKGAILAGMEWAEEIINGAAGKEISSVNGNIKHIVETSRNIVLAESGMFHEKYMKYMDFIIVTK